MSSDDIPPTGSPRSAIVVWLQLLGLIAAVGLFGWIILRLTMALRH